MLAGLYTQEESWYSVPLEAELTPVAIMRMEGLGKLKNPMSSSGIKSATWLMA
jgi:hypothetical protein